MKRFILILLVISSTTAGAQNWRFFRHEFSFGIGASNFLGEVGGRDQEGVNDIRDLEFRMTRPTFQGAYAFMFNPYLKGRVNLLFGWLSGDDATTNERFRQNRNLHFRTILPEASLIFEFYPFRERFTRFYQMRAAKGNAGSYFSPYLFAGISGFYFNPKAQDPNSGDWVALQPLGTEGQGLPGGPEQYSRLAISIPMGIGLKYAINKQWSIGLEVSGRLTFTDYIDDVSGEYYDNAAIEAANGAQAAYFADPNLGLIPTFTDGAYVYDPTRAGMQRGDPSDNDSYMFAIFSVHYRLLKGRFNMPKF